MVSIPASLALGSIWSQPEESHEAKDKVGVTRVTWPLHPAQAGPVISAPQGQGLPQVF